MEPALVAVSLFTLGALIAIVLIAEKKSSDADRSGAARRYMATVEERL